MRCHHLRCLNPHPAPTRARGPPTHPKIHTPFPHASHITPTPGASGIELFGNYSVTGPARIVKADKCLVAHLAPSGRVDAMEGGTCDTLSTTTLYCDEGEPCSLIAEHVELHGEFWLVGGMADLADSSVELQGVHTLGSKVVLSVSHLPDHTEIVLEAGAQLKHPVNMRG